MLRVQYSFKSILSIFPISIFTLVSSLHSISKYNMISTRGMVRYILLFLFYSFFIPIFILTSSPISFLTSMAAYFMDDFIGDGEGGRGITFTPKSGTYANVIYWFHGLGDTAEGWSDLISTINAPNTKFVLPTAPSRPISLNGGYSMPGWSDIYDLNKFTEEDSEGFNLSAERVNKMIQKEVDNGINPSKIIVGGFSQGGALAFHIALRSKFTLGGCIALSTWLPLRQDYPTALSEKSKNLPILQMHGAADHVVAYQYGKESHELLQTIITEPTPLFVKIDNMGHGWSDQEREPLQSFVDRIIA